MILELLYIPESRDEEFEYPDTALYYLESSLACMHPILEHPKGHILDKEPLYILEGRDEALEYGTEGNEMSMKY